MGASGKAAGRREPGLGAPRNPTACPRGQRAMARSGPAPRQGLCWAIPAPGWLSSPAAMPHSRQPPPHAYQRFASSMKVGGRDGTGEEQLGEEQLPVCDGAMLPLGHLHTARLCPEIYCTGQGAQCIDAAKH